MKKAYRITTTTEIDVAVGEGEDIHELCNEHLELHPKSTTAKLVISGHITGSYEIHEIRNEIAEEPESLYDTVDFPAYALSALINDDYSGIDEIDALRLNKWCRRVETGVRDDRGDDYVAVYNPLDGDAFFSKRCAFGLACDCVSLEIHAIKDYTKKEVGYGQVE